MKQRIKNLIGKCRDIQIDREWALNSWSGSSAVADMLQEQIDIVEVIILDLEKLLKDGE